MVKMHSWFKNLISLDELKVSLLALSLIGILIIDGFIAIKRGDVPPQLASITITIISAVAGFNAISVVTGNFSANRNGQQTTQFPMQNNMSGYNSYNTMSTPITQPAIQTNTVKPQDRGI